MDHPALFLLSVCSSRSLIVINSVGWKEIKRIEFCSHGGTTYLSIVGEVNYDRRRILQIDPISYMESEGQYKPLSIFGLDAFYEFPRNTEKMDQSLIIYTDDSPDEKLAESTRAHFFSLFGSHLHFFVQCYENSVVQIPLLTNVKETALHHETPVESQKLNNYFELSPNQEIVQLLGPITNLLDLNSSFFNSHHLRIQTEEVFFNQVLMNFKGRTLVSSETIVSDDSIIKFLEKWVSNESFHNLEVVWIRMEENSRLSPAKIMQNFLIKKFDQSRPPPEIQQPAKMTFQAKVCHFSIKLASPIYVVRDYDGTVASVEIKEDSFIFSVWNSNEKQFIDGYCDENIL